MEKKRIKGKKLFKVFLGILIVVTVVLLIMVLVQGKSISSNSALVNELYGYLGNNDLSYCDGLNVYNDKTVNYDTIDNDNRICNATSSLYIAEDYTTMKIDKSKKNNTCTVEDTITFATDNYEDDICTVYRIDKEKVHKNYKDIYGKDLEKDESFSLNNTMACHPNGDYYYCGLSETFTVTVGGEPQTFRSIKRANQKGNSIIIYDYFIKVVNEECYTSFVGETKNNNCTAEYTAETKINYNYLKKYGTLYKHTYKKVSDNKYYWVESTPEK